METHLLDDKSLKLVYLMLAAFSHKAQIVTDPTAVKGEPAAACLAC